MSKWKKLLLAIFIFFGLAALFFDGEEKSTHKIPEKADESVQKKQETTAEKGVVQEPTSAPEEKNESKPQNIEEAGLVTRVIDGDTIVVLLNGREEKVRLIGIDTPERGRPYFEEATKKTAELVLGKKVRLEKDVSERDKYGRLLRYVYVGSIFLNAELVRQGYAMVYTYPPDVKYSEYFLKLQQEARIKKRGLWGETGSTNSSGKAETYYVASARSDVFHRPDCQWAKKIVPYNLIKFKSREEAVNSGRRPCKVCNP
ncbi:MAG: thermonuclease family protein [candidate division WOR-3 bacterium]